jgi:acyl carrier protein
MPALIDDVLTLARELLQDPQLAASSALIDARGYDSLTHVRFVLALQQQFGVAIGEDDLSETSRIADVARVIETRRG